MPIGFIEVASDKDRLEEFRRVAAFNRYCGIDVQEISPREVQRVVSAREGRRHRSRFLCEGRWSRESGRRHDGARQRRQDARREDLRRRAGHRRAEEERPRDGRQHSVRRHPDRLRRELRGHVGEGAGRAIRRRHLEPGGRALLPDHRAHQGPAAEHAGAGGPVRLRLLPRGRRRPHGRPVRAGVCAVEDRRHSNGHAVHRLAARLGAHDALPRDGHVARANHGRSRHEEVFLRSRELHARPEADRRRGTRAARLLRRGRAQLHRHPDRGRTRPCDGALDHQRPARRRRDRHEHRPRVALPGESGLPAIAHGRIARHGLQVPLPDAFAADRTRRATLAVSRPARRAGRLLHRDQWLGISRVVCRAWRRRGRRPSHVGTADLVVALGRRSIAPRARTSSSWTCRSWANSWCRGATPACA